MDGRWLALCLWRVVESLCSLCTITCMFLLSRRPPRAGDDNTSTHSQCRLATWVEQKRAGPASKELTSAAEVEAIKKEEAVIVVNAGPATETWTKLASSMRDAVYWCHTSNKAAIKALGVKAGAITILKDFDDKVKSGVKVSEAHVKNKENTY